MRPARVEVLCIGTELLTGKVNTHMAYLAPALRGVGLSIARETSVGDSVAEIRGAVAEALSRADVLLVTGGLGPTFDDLTREGVAEALGVRLAYRPALFEAIRRRFGRYRLRVPEENKRQAWILEGAAVLSNGRGSAPGQRLLRGRQAVFLLPGPAGEMMPMVQRHVLPFLRRRCSGGRVARKTVLRMAMIAESAADERLDPLYKTARRRGVEFTILSEPGLVDLHVTAFGANAREAERRLAAAATAARRRVGRWVFGEGDATLESAAGDRLRRRGWTLALAESCTGGLVSERVTSVPGSSAYFLGGAVCYADAAKRRELGVPAGLLARHGAVSAACARAMAEGALRRWGADRAVAVTGIAGPGGGTGPKPVGLTFVACAAPARPTRVERHRFPGGRAVVRARAATAALWLLLNSLPKR